MQLMNKTPLGAAWTACVSLDICFTVGCTCKANGCDIGIYFKFFFEVIPGAMKAHEDDVNREIFHSWMPICRGPRRIKNMKYGTGLPHGI